MADTKYTDELAERIAQQIEELVPITLAPVFEGISYPTFTRWMNGEGGIPKGKVRNFRNRIQRARAIAVKGRIGNIQKAGDGGDWRADAWYLEHVYADDFAAKTRNEHSGPDGAPLLVTIIRDHAPAEDA